MKTIQILFILLAVVMLLTSCSDFTSEPRYTKERYVVTGMLYTGQGITMENPISVGNTFNANGGNIQNIAIDSASVRIIDTTDNNKIYPLTFGFDLLNLKIGYYEPSGDLIVSAGHTYKLEAVIGADTVSAVTTVPDSIRVVENAGYSFENIQPYQTMKYDLVDLDYKTWIETFTPANINIWVEYYCLDEWNEVEYTMPFGNITKPEDEEEYENMTDGSPRKHTGYYQYKPVLQDGKYLVSLGFTQLSYAFYGNYRVKVYSIDQNYYSYLYKPEGYRFGGIKNGYGYFGSANGQELWTKIIE